MKKGFFKSYILAGVLVLVPIWVTFSVIDYLIQKFDSFMALLPEAYRPDTLLGFHIPGLGLVIVVLIIFFTGMLATNFVGTYLINIWDAVLARIPLVRSIHTSVKTILSTMFSSGGQSFRKVLLIEYPRKGLWVLAFQTGSGLPSVSTHLGIEMVSVFVPTTPNPTGGFLLLVPKQDVIELNMSVDNALKMIISMGAITPKLVDNELKAS